MRKAAITALCLLAVGLPARAQEWNVVRRTFTFFDSRLTVDVLVESPGVLRLIRGEAGEVQVAGHAERGFAGFGLAGRGDNELKLTALGAEQVEYLVIVPERVRVQIRLPDRMLSETFASTSDNATFTWEATPADDEGEAAPERTEPRWRPETERRMREAMADTVRPGTTPGAERTHTAASEATEPGAGYFTAYAGTIPELISLPDAARIRTVTIRVENERFRIDASRPMSLTPGDPRILEIRPEGPPMDVVIYLPDRVSEFVLRLGDAPTFAMIQGDPLVFCTPVIEQWLDDGRRWFTFTPIDGRMQCGGEGERQANANPAASH